MSKSVTTFWVTITFIPIAIWILLDILLRDRCRFSYDFGRVVQVHLFHCLHPLVGSIVDTLYNRYCLDLLPNVAIDILYNKYFLCKQGDGRLQTALPQVLLLVITMTCLVISSLNCKPGLAWPC